MKSFHLYQRCPNISSMLAHQFCISVMWSETEQTRKHLYASMLLGPFWHVSDVLRKEGSQTEGHVLCCKMDVSQSTGMLFYHQNEDLIALLFHCFQHHLSPQIDPRSDKPKILILCPVRNRLKAICFVRFVKEQCIGSCLLALVLPVVIFSVL